MRRAVVVVALVCVALGAGFPLLARDGAIRHAAERLGIMTALPGWYQRLIYPLAYTSEIRAAAAKNHLDPALVAAIIYQESRFDRSSGSAQGAVGLMQILPSTALDIAHTTGGTGFVVGDLDDPRVNILYGCYYLRSLLDHYHGSLVEAVAAYNAGSGRVDEWVAKAAARHQSLRTSDILFSETRNYVSDVLRLRTIYRHAYGHDLRE